MKKLKIDPVELAKGYEDEKSPCFICFVKGICTSACQGLWDYNEELMVIGNKLVLKWRPDPDVERNVQQILHLFSTTREYKLTLGMLKHEPTLAFIKNGQYYQNRQQFILKNYMNKHGNMMSGESISSSSCSSSYVSTPPLSVPFSQGPPVKPHHKYTYLQRLINYVKPTKNINYNLSRRV